MNNITLIIILGIIGLSLGSFINALVWRLNKQSNSKIKAERKEFSISRGRSMCPNCRHVLYVVDLIPVLSWLLLKGRCRYCRKRISISYPLVEVLATGIFIISYIYWPLRFNSQGVFIFVIWLIMLVFLIALALYDIRWMTLPNKLLYPVYVLVIIQVLATVIFFNGRGFYLLDILGGFLVGGGVFYLLFQISKGKWIGGGDVKLGAILGLYLGSAGEAVLMIFFASLLGSVYAVPLLATKKAGRKSLIPYGPFLILAAIILRLCWNIINSWLTSKGVFI